MPKIYTKAGIRGKDWEREGGGFQPHKTRQQYLTTHSSLLSTQCSTTHSFSVSDASTKLQRAERRQAELGECLHVKIA